MSRPEDQIIGMLDYIDETYGQDLVIHAPCATASAVAPMHETEPKEAGDGLD